MTPRLGYWKLRGAGQPIRSLLVYVGEEYEDKMYDLDLKNPEVKKEWLQDKFNLGLDFPNLPYYIDGDTKITGTLAISRYIARKHNLEGRTEDERVKVDLLQQVTYDAYWSDFLPIFFRHTTDKVGREKELETYVKGPLVKHFENFSKFLGDKKFYISDNVTYADFFVYELFMNFECVAPELMEKFPNIKNFKQRIEELPAIAKFMKTEKYTKYLQDPLDGLMAD